MTDPDLLAKRLALIETAVRVGFRNVLVHAYDKVDLRVVQDVMTHHLDDLLALVQAVRIGVSR